MVVRMRSWRASQAAFTDTTSTTATWSARETIAGRSSAITSDAEARVAANSPAAERDGGQQRDGEATTSLQ